MRIYDKTRYISSLKNYLPNSQAGEGSYFGHWFPCCRSPVDTVPGQHSQLIDIAYSCATIPTYGCTYYEGCTADFLITKFSLGSILPLIYWL